MVENSHSSPHEDLTQEHPSYPQAEMLLESFKAIGENKSWYSAFALPTAEKLLPDTTNILNRFKNSLAFYQMPEELLHDTYQRLVAENMRIDGSNELYYAVKTRVAKDNFKAMYNAQKRTFVGSASKPTPDQMRLQVIKDSTVLAHAVIFKLSHAGERPSRPNPFEVQARLLKAGFTKTGINMRNETYAHAFINENDTPDIYQACITNTDDVLSQTHLASVVCTLITPPDSMRQWSSGGEINTKTEFARFLAAHPQLQ